ncbi:LOW QUALITY PROTEIN: protein phosphatase 1 regulatory subunit 7-like [Haliotis rubra]|uniref:LOW QUALITY PROTEIN: protein phosphatase 1 regulatory subunit 7-like n=1 Tax=Haliotis rubra TaxID=36100 RepID=UPI001EE57A0C|nr:LOW QUALITY PROTEIN: protein phosphatase 1 regulatory subunit 7-like [Haliotis rubra]
MGTYLTPEFVERRISRLTTVPDGWNASTNRTLYQLDLKMCQVKSLVFSFEWGKEREGFLPRQPSVLDAPERILRLDVSLNELGFLPHDSLLPFRNLRELDASLNKLKNFQGIEVLHHLFSLNLAHNALRHIDGLTTSSSLVEIDLSMNEIRDISSLPSLINLRILNLSSNKLISLEGLSSLPKLEELNVQRNQLVSIVPITSCLHLRMLNAAENELKELDSVTAVLQKMTWLRVLSLHGNPIDREHNYQTDIIRAANVMTLDNISVRPLPRRGVEHRHHIDNIITLKDAAKQAFEERMRGARGAMEDNVRFLQHRIQSLQHEYQEFEHKMRSDLDVCLRYMDTLSSTEASSFDRRSLNFQPGHERPWEGYKHRSPRPDHRHKEDYTDVKNTDEVLKCAYNELARDQSRLEDV